MRRVICQNNVFYHHHINSIPISPLSVAPIINVNNKYNFSTTKPKKSKIRIVQDEYDEFDDENNEEIEEASIEKEKQRSFKENASQTISNMKFSDNEKEEENRSKIDKYIGIHIGFDNILPRMIALRDKDPESITKVMNTFWIGNVLTGIPFFLLCWQCSSYIVYPELILAYFIMRYTANYIPGSTMNRKLVELYKLKYPLLNDCNWSRKVPDPTRQSVDAFAHNITNKIPILQRIESFLDNNFIGKYMKEFRERVYSNAIKHGFAWDIADNTRIIIGLPILFGLFHYGGIGLYVADSEHYNAIFAQWMCTYIGGAYGARLTANWTLRVMALTAIEKQFGLRSQTGEYYGFHSEANNVNKKRTMSSQTDNDSDSINTAKVSSRKPKKK